MNQTILNRAGSLPSDDWYQIEVPGEHLNAAAKVVQIIDGPAIESLVNRFKADAAAPNFAGVLIDRDHLSLDSDSTTEAMGWVHELRNREGIPEARIEWTSAGLPLVKGKTYKFFSTVYEPADLKEAGSRVVNGKKYRAVRPLRLARLALTNDPNNKGGRSISNRAGESASEEENQTNMLTKIIPVLGLKADATEEAVLVELQAIVNRAGQVAALTKERDALLGAQVETDLEKFKAVIKNRDAVKAQLLANRASTLALLESLQAPTEATARITNRATAKAPVGDLETTTTEATSEQAAKATRISNRALVIVREKSRPGVTYPFSRAFAEASAEEGN